MASWTPNWATIFVWPYSFRSRLVGRCFWHRLSFLPRKLVFSMTCWRCKATTGQWQVPACRTMSTSSRTSTPSPRSTTAPGEENNPVVWLTLVYETHTWYKSHTRFMTLVHQSVNLKGPWQGRVGHTSHTGVYEGIVSEESCHQATGKGRKGSPQPASPLSKRRNLKIKNNHSHWHWMTLITMLRMRER